MRAKYATNLGILFVSAATLLLELTLMRLFAVAQWYHYAFLSVSVALLGNALSGTLAALLSSCWLRRLDGWAAATLPLSVLAAYLVLNHLPFDAYQLAWDPWQLAFFGLNVASLMLPFALSGYLMVRSIGGHAQGDRADASQSHIRYGANLLGGALGGVVIMLALPALGEMTVLVVAILATLGGLLLRLAQEERAAGKRRLVWCAAAFSGAVCALLLTLEPAWMSLSISPYKGLTQALRAREAASLFQAWNTHSRVDVVRSTGLHSAPGLSLAYPGRLPPQLGLFVDADGLSPLPQRAGNADESYLSYLPEAIPYALRPGAKALVLAPRGGTQVALALHEGARTVVAAEDNALVLDVVQEHYDAVLDGLYRDPRVTVLAESGRSALSHLDGPFDLVVLPLSDPYHPLAVGAYALNENYAYTVEGLADALTLLNDRGVLVVTRWAQDPPVEMLRAASLLLEALASGGFAASEGAGAGDHLIIYRTWNTVTLLASPTPFSDVDISAVRQRCAALGWDPLHHADMTIQPTDRAIITSGPSEHALLQTLLTDPHRLATFDARSYDISPPTDDRPFFDHYFHWTQLPAIVAGLGKTWQPFGGSGYLLVLVLLVAAVLMALALTATAWRRSRMRQTSLPSEPKRAVAYFALIGLAFMLVEMPLLQQFILYLGHPARAFAVVLATLLSSSGLGSLLAGRASLRRALVALTLAIALCAALVRPLAQATLHWPLAVRIVASIGWLAPLGLLMGIPLSGGLRRLGSGLHGAMPWVWAANGGASVVSSILATVLALAIGYRAVLLLGGLCYLAAALCLWPVSMPRQLNAPHEPAAQRPRRRSVR